MSHSVGFYNSSVYSKNFFLMKTFIILLLLRMQFIDCKLMQRLHGISVLLKVLRIYCSASDKYLLLCILFNLCTNCFYLLSIALQEQYT